jgi:putative tricarboxylic transport membrane protein
MIISRGSFSIFIERPLSATFLALTVLMLGWAIWSGRRAARREVAAAEAKAAAE